MRLKFKDKMDAVSVMNYAAKGGYFSRVIEEEYMDDHFDYVVEIRGPEVDIVLSLRDMLRKLKALEVLFKQFNNRAIPSGSERMSKQSLIETIDELNNQLRSVMKEGRAIGEDFHKQIYQIEDLVIYLNKEV